MTPASDPLLADGEQRLLQGKESSGDASLSEDGPMFSLCSVPSTTRTASFSLPSVYTGHRNKAWRENGTFTPSRFRRST